MSKDTTLVLGASENQDRYSNMAIKSLVQHNKKVKAIGLRNGNAAGVEIIKEKADFNDIHTVTLYMNDKNQEQYEDYILGLKPERIIFNPGAENSRLAAKARKQNIKTMNACTLVLLSTGQY